MKTISYKNEKYIKYDNGVMIPVTYLAERKQVSTPSDVKLRLSDIATAEQEIFKIITLDASNRVIFDHIITIGLLNATQIHPREVFRKAILDNSAGIICAHNHPSGNLDPSGSDWIITRRLVESARIIGIPIIDHVIVYANSITSMRKLKPRYFTTEGEC